jgi:formamidase
MSATVRVRFGLRKGEAAARNIRDLRFTRADYYLPPEFRQQAYAICSVAVDLKISQVVDAPNMLVSAFLPEDIFAS